MKLSFLLLALSLWLPVAFAQPNDAALTAEFDKLLSAQFKPGETGATALVSRKGQIIYQKAFGMANLELNVPMQMDNVFRIGSITKQFTAVAILQLVEQGKLSLQDEITKFIPDYPMHGYKITIEHLLTHTSGIKSYTNMKDFEERITLDLKPMEVIDHFKNQPMEFAPGTSWNYNNSGYFLLGYIIEKVSGKTYPEYVEQQFFKPLGMTHSLYGSDEKIVKNRAAGYDKDDSTTVNAHSMSMLLPYAAGSIQSTVGDLYKWHQALHSYKLVKKESLDKAFTPYKLANGKLEQYGYGFGFQNVQGSPTIEHGGGINGFLTKAMYLPKEDVFVAVFSNCNCQSPSDVAAKMAALTLGKPYGYKEITLDSKVLQEYTGVYENKEGQARFISLENNQLHSQRGGGPKLKLKAWEKDKFFIEDRLNTLVFGRNSKGGVDKVTLKGREDDQLWTKTNKPLPAAKTEIQVDEAVLSTYVGEYELTKSFVLTITKEGNRLFGQATGQGKNELFASSPTQFFLKVVDAQVEFVKDDAGKVGKLILSQGGRKSEGVRVR